MLDDVNNIIDVIVPITQQKAIEDAAGKKLIDKEKKKKHKKQKE